MQRRASCPSSGQSRGPSTAAVLCRLGEPGNASAHFSPTTTQSPLTRKPRTLSRSAAAAPFPASQGLWSGPVPPRSYVAALSNGQQPTQSPSTPKSAEEGPLTVPCRLVVPYHPTRHGQQLVLVGDSKALGDWDVTKGLPFNWCEGHSHSATVDLPIHTPLTCKLTVVGQDGSAVWEPESDRELLLAPTSLATRAAGYTLLLHWGYPDCTQLLTNTLRWGANSGSNGGGGSVVGAGKGSSSAGGSEGPDGGAERSSEVEAEVVQCQVEVLLPPSGPSLSPDQSLVLVGSSPALGRWDPAGGLPLEQLAPDSPMWVAAVELPLAEGLQAKVVVVDAVSGKACVWEPCENRSLARLGGPRPVVVVGYWGMAATCCVEVDRLGVAAVASNPKVVQVLRQQLAATSSQLDGLRKERDDARRAMVVNEEQLKKLEGKAGGRSSDKHLTLTGRNEMTQLAAQLQTTRRLYDTAKREAAELGGSVGVTRQLCDTAKRELGGLAAQLEAARRAYEALAPQVERMERQLATTTRAFEATQPELAALETQLERARSMSDRTLQKIEAAKVLAASGEYDKTALRRRTSERASVAGVREIHFAKF